MTESLPGGFDSELAIRRDGYRTWRLLAPLIWTGTNDDTFTVPIHFRTDFATVPRFLRGVIEPYGPYTPAAVLHDWLLVELADWQSRRARPGETIAMRAEAPPANSRDADGIFRRVMHDLGTPWGTRWIMWTAVRWASLFSSRRAYGRQIGRDLPAMLGMSVLAIVIALPGAVGTLISLGLAGVTNAVTGRPRKVPARGSLARDVPRGKDR